MVSTFHGFCLLLLKSSPNFFSSEFSILDEHDAAELVSRMLKKYGLCKQFSVRDVTSWLSRMGNDPEYARVEGQNRTLLEFSERYRVEKRAMRAYDFDDILSVIVEKLEDSEEFRNYVATRFCHVLVDEYQDTNSIQHRLIKLLHEPHKLGMLDMPATIFAVGDQDQSIYSWRGACVANVEGFLKDFAPVNLVKLEDNYRSKKQILSLANRAILFNSDRIEKVLKPMRTGSEVSVVRYEFDNEFDEARFIASVALELKRSKPEEQIVVLFRANYLSRVIESELVRGGITYKIFGGTKFFDRKEIKDCFAYMRLVANPYDWISFGRAIAIPSRGLGAVFLEKFYEFAQARDMGFADALSEFLIQAKIGPAQAQSVRQFLRIFDGLSPDMAPGPVLDLIVERMGFLAHIKSEYEAEDAESRIANIVELKSLCSNLEENKIEMPDGSTVKTLRDFLNHTTLVEQEEIVADRPTVLMMTIHAAKGLEFSNVILAGCQDGILPYKASLALDKTLAEECRLLYVAITRAKDRLVLTSSVWRSGYGGGESYSECRFLETSGSLVSLEKARKPEFQGRRIGQWIAGIEFLKHTFDEGIGMAGMEKRVDELKTKVADSREGVGQTFKNAEVLPAHKTRAFSKGSFVSHPKFGKGIVQAAHRDENGQLYLSVTFGKMEKKLLSSFLSLVVE
jgi:DNA helicase II / ATP-dependent DNA helicase PcrA